MDIASLSRVGGAAELFAGIAGSGSSSLLPTVDFGPDSIVDLSSATGATGAILGQAYGPPDTRLPYAVEKRRELERRRDLLAAQSALLDKNYAKVRDVAGTMLRRDHTDSAANHLIARSYQAEGDVSKAVEFYARAVHQSPDNERFVSDLRNAQLLGKPERTAIGAAVGMLNDPSQRAAGLRLMSLVADRTENASTLIALGDAFAKIRAKQQALGAYALALEKAASTAEQEAILKRADDLVGDEPEAAVAHDFRGKALLKLGRHEMAIDAFKRARDIMPDEPQYTIDLADAYVARGRERKDRGNHLSAKEDFESARLLRPAFAPYKREIAATRLELGRQWLSRGALRSALGELNAARVAMPADEDELKRRLSNLYYSLGNRYARKSDWATATGVFQHAYDLNGSLANKTVLADARNSFGLQFMAQEEWRKAVDQFKLAVKLFPNNETYAANLAEAESHLA